MLYPSSSDGSHAYLHQRSCTSWAHASRYARFLFSAEARLTIQKKNTAIPDTPSTAHYTEKPIAAPAKSGHIPKSAARGRKARGGTDNGSSTAATTAAANNNAYMMGLTAGIPVTYGGPGGAGDGGGGGCS